MGLSNLIDFSPKERPWDGWLLLSVCSLVAIGVVMVYSASAITSLWTYQDEFHYFTRQLIYVFIGLVFLIIGFKVDYRLYQRFAYPILFFTILALGAVLGVGTVVNNARRWIRLGGFNIQPAEIAKVTMAFYFAYSMTKKKEKMKTFLIGIVPHVMILGFVGVLLMLEPDLGTCLLLAALMGAMMIFSGSSIPILFGGLGVVGGAAWLIISHTDRIKRIEAFFDPWSHAQDSAYQITQGFISIGNGGMTGKGIGEGLGKLGFIPELHTDCIGDMIAEEFGFVGICVIIALFTFFTFRGVLISIRARDTFGRLVAFGLTVTIALQAGINLAVIAGAIPSKGFTLPFVSYGGSSLIMCLFAVGVLMNISKCEEDKHAIEQEKKEREKKERKFLDKLARIQARRLGKTQD